MLRADDAHVAHLLDQRAARARAAAVDQGYDSPSIYSSPFFSPRPNDILSDTRSLNSYHSPMSSPAPEARSRLNELAHSMLDLEDDPNSDSDSDDDDDAQPTIDADHDDPDDTRMSLLGPKMRFHGKAPWEMDSAALEEEDEPELDTRGRDGIRSLGRSFRSSSRGTTASSRPSGESSRSNQAKPKRSFDTTLSSPNSPYGRGGAMHALAQASVSSSSLVMQPAPPRQTGLRLNFPLSRSATPPRGPPSPRSTTSHHSNAPSPVPRNNHEYAHFPSSNKPSLIRRATNDSAASHYSEEMHPYANPDLVFSYADDQLPTPGRSDFSVARSDSIATVTESLTTTTSLSRSTTGSTMTPDTSTSSMATSQSPRSRASMFRGKEISAPLPMSPPLPTNHISAALMAPAMPPGWAERSASPTFALISLEQARAQRSRSATAQNLSISSTSSTPFPEVPQSGGEDPSPPSSIASRARVRSISTGARAKTALQNIVGGVPTRPPPPERHDSEPTPSSQQGPSGASGKTLKHKKSGFMRLFNGGRGAGAEKEEKTSPPPVPSLSEGYAAYNAQQNSARSIHRVPPPQISPSMMQAPNNWDEPGPSPGSRPTPPSLSINTGPGSRLRASSAADDFQTRTVPSHMSDRDWHQAELPQSAPPNITEFPALKLRPVSTLFSAHFGDHIVSRDSDPQPGFDPDADTLSSTSPSTMVSPLTPGLSLSRGSSDKAPMATISEDQSTLVQALQEQLATAKKAWQRHIWELEGQVRDLKAEVDGLRANGDTYCDACGRGRPPTAPRDHKAFTGGVVNRPRARTGTSARFGSAV